MWYETLSRSGWVFHHFTNNARPEHDPEEDPGEENSQEDDSQEENYQEDDSQEDDLGV